MSKNKRAREVPVRHGNAFPWLGILAGVKRMMYYLFLLACLLVVLGVIVLLGCMVTDNEGAADCF